MSAPTSVLERVLVGNKVSQIAPIVALNPKPTWYSSGEGKGGAGKRPSPELIGPKSDTIVQPP